MHIMVIELVQNYDLLKFAIAYSSLTIHLAERLSNQTEMSQTVEVM